MNKIALLWPYTQTEQGDIHVYLISSAVHEQFATKLTENSIHTLRLFAEQHFTIGYNEYTSIQERVTPGRKIDIWSQGNIVGRVSLPSFREKLLDLGYYDIETPMSQVQDIRAVQATPVNIVIGKHELSQ